MNAFVDASWDPGFPSAKSVTGGLVTLSDDSGVHVPLQWVSRQSEVHLSSAGAELSAAKTVVRELEFLVPFIGELLQDKHVDVVLHADASTVVRWLTTWGGVSDKAEQRRVQYIRQIIQLLKIRVNKIAGIAHPADALTKPVKPDLLRNVCRGDVDYMMLITEHSHASLTFGCCASRSGQSVSRPYIHPLLPLPPLCHPFPPPPLFVTSGRSKRSGRVRRLRRAQAVRGQRTSSAAQRSAAQRGTLPHPATCCGVWLSM